MTGYIITACAISAAALGVGGTAIPYAHAVKRELDQLRVANKWQERHLKNLQFRADQGLNRQVSRAGGVCHANCWRAAQIVLKSPQFSESDFQLQLFNSGHRGHAIKGCYVSEEDVNVQSQYEANYDVVASDPNTRWLNIEGFQRRLNRPLADYYQDEFLVQKGSSLTALTAKLGDSFPVMLVPFTDGHDRHTIEVDRRGFYDPNVGRYAVDNVETLTQLLTDFLQAHYPQMYADHALYLQK